MDQDFIPSAAEQLASELSGTGKSQYTGLLFPVPTRLQLNIYSMVEALTHRAGTSRNKLMNQLLQAGIEAVMNELDDEAAMDIRENANMVVHSAIEKNAGLMERGDA